jgi:hypothetical protein
MNTTPTIKITEEGPEVGVATARLLLQHALDNEAQNEDGDTPDLARKRAIKASTGASEFLPPKVTPVELPVPKPPSPTSEETTPEGSEPVKVEAGLITDAQHRGD